MTKSHDAANRQESDRDFASKVVTRANLMGFGAYSQVEWCNMAARLSYIVLRLTAEPKA